MGAVRPVAIRLYLEQRPSQQADPSSRDPATLSNGSRTVRFGPSSRPVRWAGFKPGDCRYDERGV